MHIWWHTSRWEFIQNYKLNKNSDTTLKPDHSFNLKANVQLRGFREYYSSKTTSPQLKVIFLDSDVW